MKHVISFFLPAWLFCILPLADLAAEEQPPAAPAQAALETWTFSQPDDFPPDMRVSFEELSPEDREFNNAAARRALEAEGIHFHTGSAVQISNYQLIVRNTPDQLAVIQLLMDKLNEPAVLQVMLRAEIFSATPAQYTAIMASGADGTALYDWCAEALDKPETGVALEQFSLLRVRSGQRSKVEEINEYPFPTEYDPPALPADPVMGVSDPQRHVREAMTPAPATPGTGIVHPPVYPASNATGFPGTAPTPQSFETKNLGFSLEAEVNVGDDGKLVDMNLAPEFIKVVRVIPWHASQDVYQPVFQTRKLSCQILCEMGKTKFVGAISTPVQAGVAGADKEDRLWLMFITPSTPE